MLRHRPTASQAKLTAAQGAQRTVLATLLVLGLTLPLLIVLYFVWLGAQLWK